jgi:hypothetical protein
MDIQKKRQINKKYQKSEKNRKEGTVMNQELFEDLSKSIKEAGKIRRGEVKASRVFTYSDVIHLWDLLKPRLSW